MNPSSSESVKTEVRSASQHWIQHFNQGNAEACIKAYTTDAMMQAKPIGTFHGTEAIAAFWKPFIASGAQNLEYQDVQLEVVDESTVILSANWTMNVARGVISREKWVKQHDGRWLLEEDCFEVLEQYS